MSEVNNINFIIGDLTEANEKYIVHQCNCTTKSAKGLAATIFRKFPYADVYNVIGNRNDIPGTIKVMGNGQKNRYVINLFGQIAGGKPKPNKESAEQRLQYFRAGLQKISEIQNLESVAFPYLIGCGLAGGDWNLYLNEIQNFANNVNAKVSIYKLKP